MKEKKLKPQKESEFTLTSSPGSTVYLLAVDRSVNLLRRGNNIDSARISQERNHFNAYKNLISTHEEKDHFYVGDTNVFVLSNANKGSEVCIDSRLTETSFFNELETPGVEETPDEIFEGFESITRKEFPETWIFEKFDMGKESTHSFKKKVPDTITSWDITGFSLCKNNGFGLAVPQELIVHQDFFVQLNLPYSIRVGEILKVEATVFSYYKAQKNNQFLDVNVILFSETDVEVVTVSEPAASESSTEETELFKEDEDEENSAPLDGAKQIEFEFFDASNSGGICTFQSSIVDNKNKKSTTQIKVGKSSGTRVNFFIKSIKSGPIKIKIRAEVIRKNKVMAFDEVEKKIKVEHEGLTEYNDKVILLNLNDSAFNFDFETKIETEFKNSIRNHVSVIGNMMGPAIVSTENLM